MSVQLTVNNNTYNYPTSGEAPGWGADATDWAVAVTEALQLLLSPGDILRTTFTIQDDISVPTNVQGLIFDGATVRAANVTYAISRNTIVESGTMYLSYNPSGGVGEKWTMNIQRTNSVDVAFTITDTGQVQYTSYLGSPGTMIFSAKTLSA